MSRATTTGELQRLRQVLAGGASYAAAARELGRGQEWVRTWNARFGGRPRIALTHHVPALPPWLLAHRAAVARARLGRMLAILRLNARISGQVLDEARLSSPTSNVSGNGKETPGTGPGVSLEFM